MFKNKAIVTMLLMSCGLGSISTPARADNPIRDLGASTTMIVGVGLMMAGTTWAGIVVGGAPVGGAAALVGTTSFFIAEVVADKKMDIAFLQNDAKEYLLNAEQGMSPLLMEIIEEARQRAENEGQKEVAEQSPAQWAHVILTTY